MNRRTFCAALLLALLASVATGHGQTQPNSNALYHQLRDLLPGGASASADNLILKRDAATFTFTHGKFAFFGEVNGKVTGAVFSGNGHFHLTPPTPNERRSLLILTKREEYDEDFTQVVLRFTDGTAAELRKAATPSVGDESGHSLTTPAIDFHNFQRLHLHENIDLRILEDVLSPTKPGDGGFFLAAIKGSSNGHILFEIDPHGARDVVPEEVKLAIWNDWGWSIPAAFHLAAEYAAKTVSSREDNNTFKVDLEDLDTTIEKGGFLGGSATLHLHALADGVVVLPFDLFPTLRVSKVEGEHGDPMDFVQERKEDDPGFGLVLNHPLNKGDAVVVHVVYGGKDAVRSAGDDNYDPVAREDWFPNGGTGFGSYSSYHMVFHSPRDVQLIATGTRLSDKVDGKMRISEWDSKMPLPVAGFHLGKFVEKDAKTSDGVAVSAYANSSLPDWASRLSHAASGDGMGPQQGGGAMPLAAVGNLNTTGMLPVELSEGTVAVEIYEAYFGKLPFDHLALSQQPASTTVKAGRCWCICPSAASGIRRSSTPSACRLPTLTGKQ